MAYIPLDNIPKVAQNRYEAIIVAAQHARYLNTKRLEKLALLEEDAEIDIDGRKITMIALKDLLDGKVQFDKADIE